MAKINKEVVNHLENEIGLSRTKCVVIVWIDNEA